MHFAPDPLAVATIELRSQHARTAELSFTEVAAAVGVIGHDRPPRTAAVNGLTPFRVDLGNLLYILGGLPGSSAGIFGTTFFTDTLGGLNLWSVER